MPRPVISLKTKRPLSAESCPHCQGGWYRYEIAVDAMQCVKCKDVKAVEHPEVPRGTPERFTYPECWNKGQLLNLRRSGDTCILTLLEEEYDPQHPERALIFQSPWDAQEFVSWWYSRDSHDPRAG